MPIFRNVNGKLKRLSDQKLAKEKDLQRLLEEKENLQEALELYFLSTEYETTFGGRIDTLAVDRDVAPVIIEYKRGQNNNVINQALSYLKWLKSQNQGFFEKLMIDKLGAVKAKEIQLDWKRPRIVCIAESYSKFDKDTAEVVPLRIELFTYRYYEDGIFSLERVPVASLAESTSPVAANASISVATTATTASIDALLSKANASTKELFVELRERIRVLDDSITERATAIYVAFRRSYNFAEVHVGNSQLKIHLRPIDYIDPRGSVEKVPDSYKWTLNRRIVLKASEDLDYVVGIIEQSYKDVL